MNHNKLRRALEIFHALLLFCISMVVPVLAYGMLDQDFAAFIGDSKNPFHWLILLIVITAIVCAQLYAQCPVVTLAYNHIGEKHPHIHTIVSMTVQFGFLAGAYIVSKELAVVWQISDLQTAKATEELLLRICIFPFTLHFINIALKKYNEKGWLENGEL